MGKKSNKKTDDVKRRKFRVTLVVEVPEDRIADIEGEANVLDIVEQQVEARWDGGVNETIGFIDDSYGFEVEEIDAI
jgi:hypothetical protein